MTLSVGKEAISPWRAFPADPADWFEPEEVAKAKAYARPLRWVNGISRLLSTAALAAVVGLHVVPELLDARGWDNWIVRLIVAVAVVQFVGMAVDIPFSAWRSLSYDRKWGFSTQKLGGFVSDQLKAAPLGLVITTLLFLPLWAIVRATDLWWVYGWLLFGGFTVLFNVLFPVLIAPIFNKYTPLEDQELREQLLGVARRVEADISEYLVEDASRRDTRQNAYVVGLGKTRRVVIYDTMLDWPPEQITSVVAHEIGHWKLRHLRKLIPTAVVLALANFVVLKLVLEWDRALEFAGVSSLGDPAVLPLFLLVFPLASSVTRLGLSWLSRVQERQADLFALETTNAPETFVGMMRRLHTDNLADLAPSRWKRISHTHPPAAERMAMGTAWGAATKPTR